MNYSSSSRRAGAANVIAGLLCTFALVWSCAMASAVARHWTGSVNGNWSEPNNWSPTGPPLPNDDLNFGDVSDSNRSMVNDLNGFLVGNLFFYNNDYQLSGNTLYFYFSVIENTEGGSHTVTINCPLVFTNFYARIESGASGGAVTENTLDIHLNGPIQVERGTLELLAMPYPDFGGGGGNGHIFVSGVVSGTGNVAAFASEVDGHVCFVEFNGTPGNTFSGALLLFTYAGGLINLNKSSGSAVTNLVVVTDRYDLLTSDTGTVNLNLVGENQIGGDAKIQIDSGLRLLLSGNNVGVGSLVLSNYHADAKASTL